MTTVKALAIGVAAKEATTRTVATKRSTIWCIAAAEAAIPVQATLTAVAEVPATSSSRTKSPVRKTEARVFPGHKSSEGESKDLEIGSLNANKEEEEEYLSRGSIQMTKKEDGFNKPYTTASRHVDLPIR
ncbi:uncharacterized protein [Triticum aestivum]|uniref:uncharacterized protein n=1 Tax=Triticum aestivum TaxID=4565 RepID=UPI001D009421|nr:uncharacterized protein LOC123161930 [Triticum aestivum]